MVVGANEKTGNRPKLKKDKFQSNLSVASNSSLFEKRRFNSVSYKQQDLADLEPMQFVEHIKNQVDVGRFLKLKGVNIHDPVHREKLTYDGAHIKEYMYRREEQIREYKARQEARNRVMNVHSKSNKAAFLTTAPEDDHGPETPSPAFKLTP